MRRLRRRTRLVWVASLLALLSLRAAGQVSSSYDQANVVVTPRIRVGQIQSEQSATATISTRISGDKLGGAGTTQESYVQEAFSTYDNFFKAAQSGVSRTPKIGGTQGNLRASTPFGPQVRLPLFEWGGSPEDAEIKLGRLYLDLFTLSGSVLYSDNVDRAEVNPRGGAVSVVRLQGRMILQITETMRLAAGGTVAWLPLENEIGFADPIANFTASLQPLFLSRFDYEVPVSPLSSINVANDFTVQSGGFGVARSFDTLQRDPNNLIDREGRRQFIQIESRPDQVRTFREGVSIRNTASVAFDTLLPTETRVTAGYARTHLWFAQGALGNAASQDVWSLDAQNERENMRFKPEFQFQARHQNNQPGFNKTIRAGFSGPITPYIDFTGSAGVLLAGASNQKGFLWRAGLAHRPRESTTHSVLFTRTLTFPAAQLVNQLSYRLQQILSPDWIFEFGYDRRLLEPVANPGALLGTKQDQLDAQFAVRLGDRFRGIAGYSFVHNVNRIVGGGRFDRHVYRLELVVDHGPLTQSSLLYEFNRLLSSRPLTSFDENVVTYTLTRRF
ncbi:MAG: hypothetical protein ISQ14_05085 [Verrucomicrobiae bacterium]|jgi:hypothetical protein|nr:hypothetical protein [Verrucomicrobiae bacterium]